MFEEDHDVLTIGFDDFVANPSAHLARIEAEGVELVVEREGHESLTILPRSKVGGLRETLFLLDNPVNAEHLRQSIASFEAGEGVVRELVKL